MTIELQMIRLNPPAVSAEDQVRLASNFRNRKFAFSRAVHFLARKFANNEPGYMGSFSQRKPHLNLREYGNLERIHWWSDELGPVRRHGLG